MLFSLGRHGQTSIHPRLSIDDWPKKYVLMSSLGTQSVNWGYLQEFRWSKGSCNTFHLVQFLGFPFAKAPTKPKSPHHNGHHLEKVVSLKLLCKTCSNLAHQKHLRTNCYCKGKGWGLVNSVTFRSFPETYEFYLLPGPCKFHLFLILNEPYSSRECFK